MKYIIGIDPGVETGIAVKDLESGKLISVSSMKIHEAMNLPHGKCFVVVEDARKWNGYTKGNFKQMRAKAQGAGSVKRDCKIWEDFLSDTNIPFLMVAPSQKGAKLDAKTFNKYTGWTERTNQHGRDAAMLIFGYNKTMIKQWKKK